MLADDKRRREVGPRCCRPNIPVPSSLFIDANHIALHRASSCDVAWRWPSGHRLLSRIRMADGERMVPNTPLSLQDERQPHELRVVIGPAVVGLRCGDGEFARMVQTWCGVFRTDADPDYWLEIDLHDGRGAAEIQQVMPLLRVHARDGWFASDPPLWEAEYRPSRRCLRFRSERDLFHPTIQPRYLNILLSSLYNSYWEDQGNVPRGAFLVHGCGVLIGNRGYLFTGPSGAGKTTVARLSQAYAVLNDEVVLLALREGSVEMAGTPLLGGLNRRSAQAVPLKTVLLLRHDDEPALREVAAREAYTRFLAQIFDLAPVLSSGTDRLRWLSERMDFARGVLERAPCYELAFRPDDSFWPLLQALP